MSFYLDTSVLVAVLTEEASTNRVQAWLAAHASEDLAISEWVVTEFSSALSIKRRTGQLQMLDKARADAGFTRMCNDFLIRFPVTSAQFQAAARYGAQENLGLRAGDALHIAICATHGAGLCTLDQKMAQAATSLGIPVHLP